MENGRIKIWLPAVRSGSGSDAFTLRLATALRAQGVEACISWFSRFDELLPFRMINARPPPYVDAIIANSWTAHAFKRNEIPLIVVVHHAVFDSALEIYKNSWQRSYHKLLAEPRERRSLIAADAVIAVSVYVAEHIKKSYGIATSRIIPNWIDTKRFIPTQETRVEHGPFRLLFVGKPTRLKGVEILPPLMHVLNHGFQLIITATETECARLNLPANTLYLGRLDEDELIKAYQQCDTLLCPSYSEGFGYAALEAMACGKPVIARDCSALADLIGTRGVLCGNDTASYINACKRLADEPDLYSELSKSARGYVEENLDGTAASAAYIELINAVIQARPNKRFRNC